MSLKFVALYPSHLNLNGDQANLLILQKRCQWSGNNAEIVSVNRGENIPNDASIVLLGHGSAAAWADIESDLPRAFEQIDQAVARGAQLIAVASGYEAAIKRGFFEGDLTEIDRISKFEVSELATNDGSFKVLGYLNAATAAPIIQENSKGIGTQLHGPFLAKNPEIADRIISLALKRRAPDSTKTDNAAIERVAGLVKDVWALEEELARE